jgi:choline dehydrogenase-like flavoprotein
MVTERFFRADFTPRGNFSDTTGSTVPESWPISYDDLVPWYERAEKLYRVRGTADPLRSGDTAVLRPPAPMTTGSAEVAEFLSDRGMHPYGLHVACESKSECRSCQTYLCPADCKNHSGNICVEPAVRRHGAALIDQTTVVELEADRTTVTRVVARRCGKTLRFRGNTVVLAAGAFMTPVVLLNSRSNEWPTGIANQHDNVGRNLMRHYIDMYLFRTQTKEPSIGQVKEIGVNDFYHLDGQNYGTLQSMGHLPPYDFLMNSGRKERRVLGPIRRLMRNRWVPPLRDRMIVLASIMEDLPYPDNRVIPGPASVGRKGPFLSLQYTMSEPDKRRHRYLTSQIRGSLRRYRGSRMSPIHLSGAKMNTGIGHHCGTCRFGNDPKTSALDPNNRAWGLDNLYVVDASMLPSSAGINPSLTIAANALRVAHVIDESL